MTIAPLATATPAPLDPKAAPTETPAIPFADVLAAMRAAPAAEPVAPPATEQPTPSCRPRAGIHPPASPTPLGDAAPWIPAQGRDDEEMPTSPTPSGSQDRTTIEPGNQPGEGRGPVTTGPQLGPGLRRGGAEDEPALVRQGFTPSTHLPAVTNFAQAAVQQPIAVPELPPLPASPEPVRTPLRAVVFNERGLLRDVGVAANEAVTWRTVALGSPREPRQAAPAAEPLESSPTASLRAPDGSVTPSHLADTALDIPPETNASPAVTPAPTAPASPTIATPTTTAPPPPPQAAPQQRAVAAAPTARIQTRQPTEPTSKRPAKPRAPEPREQQDATDTRLTLDATPQGLTLLATLARTDRDDRTRLRDRIAGLLSARGFALADVRVGTAALPSSKDR